MKNIQEATSVVKFVRKDYEGVLPNISISKSNQYIDTSILDLIEHNINRTFLDYMLKNYKNMMKATVKDIMYNKQLREDLEYDLRRRENKELIINSSLYLFATENLPKIIKLYEEKGDLSFHDINDNCYLDKCIRKIIQCKVEHI